MARSNSLKIDGKNYSLITIHSKKSSAEAEKKKYKKKGWKHVRIVERKGMRHPGKDYLVYGKYSK